MKNIFFLALVLVCFITHRCLAQGLPKVYLALEKHYAESDFEACVKLESQVEIFAASRKDTLATNSYFYLGDAFNQLGQVKKAILLWEKQIGLLKELDVKEKYNPGELNVKEEYSTMLFNLAGTYLQAGDYQKAGERADQLIKADRKLYKPFSGEYVSSVLAVADIYFNLDRLRDEETLLLAAIKQQEKNSLNEGLLLNKLGDLYTYKGEYTKAQFSLSQSVAIFKRDLNESSIPLLIANSNLGILYMQQGKYPEAQDLFEEVIKRSDPSDGEGIYFSSLNNLALVHQKLGQFEKAEHIFEQLRRQDSVVVGQTHPDYALTLSNLSMVYNDEGKYNKAETLMLSSMEILRLNKQSERSVYAGKLNNLAKVYMTSGHPDQSISLYLQAIAIYKKTTGENSVDYATAQYNLGVALWKTGKGEEGLKYLKSAASIRATVLGKSHPKYAESQQKIAEYLWLQKKKKEARQTYGEVFDNYYNQIELIFPALTEEEKAKFYYNTIRPSFDKFNSFAYDYVTEEPQIMGDVYNHQINTKGVIMLATEKVKTAINKSKDTLLIRKYEDWQSMKEQIAKLYSHNQAPKQLDSLLVIADKTEKEISRSSAEFSRQFIRKKYTWTDIQKTLKTGEAAIEVVRYQKFIPDSAGRFLEEVMYAFLVVTAKTINHPDVIVLKNGKDLENRFLKFYKNSVLFNQEDKYSYKNFFEPLANYLKQNKIEKFYLSPDGVYNQVNINTLRNSSTGKYLVDEYIINLVTNTKELVERTQKTANANSSVLLGFPKFNLDTQQKENKSASATGGSNRGLRGGLSRYVDPQNGITVLPGTQREIEKISKLLEASGPKVFVQLKASEEIAKQVNNPAILHIATHGYFLEDDEKSKDEGGYVFNPLLKSGLILAGAETYIRSGVTVDSLGNDGILTAYEAMNLNLDGTNLVVLSACETGLGEVRNGEGVYGLQRAFKLAGAKSVIMSLWNVDDDATQDLMMLFYKEFSTHGDAQEALRWAQRKLKNKYPLPFHWGAFVLVGI